MTGEPESVRPRIQQAVSEALTTEWFRERLQAIVSPTKQTYVDVDIPCKHCGKRNRQRVLASVPDPNPKFMREALDLLEQAEGRPGLADSEAGGLTIVVERNWPDAGTADSG